MRNRVSRQAERAVYTALYLMSKKWLNATFSSFYGFCLSLTLPGGKTRKVRKPDVSIRSDVHAVRAGIKLKGQPPLNNPAFFRQAKAYSLL